jgi:acetyl-CoA C-acetyltransferase
MTAKSLRRVGIYGAVRIPFARAYTAYRDDTNLSLLSAALRALVVRTKLEGERLGEVVAGATMVDPREWNLAREALMEAGLSPETPGIDLARACGTSAEAAVAVANKIALGQIDAGIAAGVDSISGLPLLYPRRFAELATASAQARSFGSRLTPWLRLRPRDLKPEPPRVKERMTGLTMGESCELMAKTWKIAREDQDRLAWESHQKAARAWKEGFFADLVVAHKGLDRDNNVRADSSLEKLATLRPVFDRSPAGTLTAGNSTPLTDGAAGVLLASEEWGRARGLEPWAFVLDAQAAAVDFFGPEREGLLMAPAYAVPRLLDRSGLRLEDFDYYEIHEAFAAQVLCTLKAWESAEFCRTKLGRDKPLGSIDRERLNVKGGSIALGHPFGATGARILGGLAKLLRDKGRGRGLVSICTGGGMGVTLILER